VKSEGSERLDRTMRVGTTAPLRGSRGPPQSHHNRKWGSPEERPSDPPDPSTEYSTKTGSADVRFADVFAFFGEFLYGFP
jgi:hypothetical protein